jgi:hypothetical protein
MREAGGEEIKPMRLESSQLKEALAEAMLENRLLENA